MSTDSNRVADPQYLVSIHTIARDIVQEIVSKQSQLPQGSALCLPHTSMKIELARPASSLELKRLMRSFIAQMKAHPDKDPATAFAEYLKVNLS